MTTPSPQGDHQSAGSETGRVEAFSDGVMAVIITLMALELHAPAGSTAHDLRELLPNFLIYALSFVLVGIYWNNHHHLLRATRMVSGPVMWANLHLLFWLSLLPLVTDWVGQQGSHSLPAAIYGAVALAEAIAYTILVIAIVKTEGGTSMVAKSIGKDNKGKLSLVIYAFAICLAFVSPWIAYALIAVVAVIWFVPDRRLERR